VDSMSRLLRHTQRKEPTGHGPRHGGPHRDGSDGPAHSGADTTTVRGIPALQSVKQVEDRNALLRQDIENCQMVLVEAMGEGSDFPKVELDRG